jgi:hypothetical protein
MEGEFRIAHQSPVPHYAMVRVSVEPLTSRHAEVSPNAFSWLRDAYGPGAATGPAHDDYKREATTGAMYALEEAGVGGAVTILDIRYANADTLPGDVKYATAYAVWSALDHAPGNPPTVDGPNIVFPDL